MLSSKRVMYSVRGWAKAGGGGGGGGDDEGKGEDGDEDIRDVALAERYICNADGVPLARERWLRKARPCPASAGEYGRETPPGVELVAQHEASSSNPGASAAAAAPHSEVARVNLPGGEGPCVFSARLHGKKGHILLVTSATSPCIAFAYTKLQRSVLASLLPGRHGKPEEAEVDIRPEFSMGLSDVAEMRKMGGFGWKGKILVGWATGREILDGLELVDRQGKKVVLTAIKGRDELFNRVLSMGEHKWECL